jgi:hypothetical protein
MNLSEILSLFHHIHHRNGEHEVHHCGGKHREKVNPRLDYTIEHCACGKHRIDKKQAIGHASDDLLKPIEVVIKFQEKWPKGGWHVESGIQI